MENQQNNIKGELVWKDRKNLIIIKYLVLVISLVLWIYLSFFTTQDNLNRVSGLVLIIVFGYFLYFQLKERVTYLSIDGVRMGNAGGDKKKRFTSFCSWSVVSSIKIVSKGHYGPLGGGSANYLVLSKKKERKVFDCVLYDPKGFVEALKKLNKYHLLSKDSKYR